MSFNKFPWTNLHGFNLDWVIETVKECKSLVDGIVQEVTDIFKTYVTKTELTNDRKLNETGNFTGKWFNETKTSIDLKILNGQNLYQEVLDLINTNPELNINIIDGGFFASTVVPNEQDLGNFIDSITNEIDAGLFIYPCTCI